MVAAYGCAGGQSYTEKYFWNGKLKIPRDNRKVIQSKNFYFSYVHAKIS